MGALAKVSARPLGGSAATSVTPASFGTLVVAENYHTDKNTATLFRGLPVTNDKILVFGWVDSLGRVATITPTNAGTFTKSVEDTSSTSAGAALATITTANSQSGVQWSTSSSQVHLIGAFLVRGVTGIASAGITRGSTTTLSLPSLSVPSNNALAVHVLISSSGGPVFGAAPTGWEKSWICDGAARMIMLTKPANSGTVGSATISQSAGVACTIISLVLTTA